MALVKEDGIAHAGGLTRWEEISRVEMLFSEVQGVRRLVALKVKGHGFNGSINPSMKQAETVAALVRQHVNAEKISEAVMIPEWDSVVGWERFVALMSLLSLLRHPGNLLTWSMGVVPQFAAWIGLGRKLAWGWWVASALEVTRSLGLVIGLVSSVIKGNAVGIFFVAVFLAVSLWALRTLSRERMMGLCGVTGPSRPTALVIVAVLGLLHRGIILLLS